MSWRYNKMRRLKKVEGRTNNLPLLQRTRRKKPVKWLLLKHQARLLVKSRQEAGKGKGKDEIEEESVYQEDLDGIDKYLVFMSRRFSKLKFKRNIAMSKSTLSYRMDNQQNKYFC